MFLNCNFLGKHFHVNDLLERCAKQLNILWEWASKLRQYNNFFVVFFMGRGQANLFGY